MLGQLKTLANDITQVIGILHELYHWKLRRLTTCSKQCSWFLKTCIGGRKITQGHRRILAGGLTHLENISQIGSFLQVRFKIIMFKIISY